MTTDERVRYVCRKLTEAVHEVAPPGLGRWDRAWDIVHGPSAAFLDALADWETDDVEATRAKVQAAAVEVVRAWRKAGQEWDAQGRPGTQVRERVTAP